MTEIEFALTFKRQKHSCHTHSLGLQHDYIDAISYLKWPSNANDWYFCYKCMLDFVLRTRDNRTGWWHVDEYLKGDLCVLCHGLIEHTEVHEFSEESDWALVTQRPGAKLAMPMINNVPGFVHCGCLAKYLLSPVVQAHIALVESC